MSPDIVFTPRPIKSRSLLAASAITRARKSSPVTLIVEMRPEGLDQLDSFVLEYRHHVEVLEPAGFREQMKRQVGRIAAVYGMSVSA